MTNNRFLAPFLLAVLLVAPIACHTTPPNSLATHDSSRWNKAMAQFAAQDATNPPPKDCIVFVGSSSIRIWKALQKDFPGLPVINRGFGGSQLADSVNFSKQIITDYQPRQVVIYAGSNDINAKKPAEIVYGDFVALVRAIRKHAPEARIAFISIAPSPSRWSQVDEVRKFNKLAKQYCDAHEIDFVDVFPMMLGEDGKPLPGIYLSDRLHMNEKGYAIWRQVLEPIVR